MNIGEIKKSDALYKKAFELRYLFFFKEHALSKSIINDEKEDKSIHVAISQNGELIAYGRLTEIYNKEFQISQMVVSPIYQRRGYGKKLLLEIVQIAKKRGSKNIMLNARTTAIGLYKKLNFQTIGKVYNSKSTGIPHIKMVYNENT